FIFQRPKAETSNSSTFRKLFTLGSLPICSTAAQKKPSQPRSRLSFISPEFQKTTEGKNRNAIMAALAVPGKNRSSVRTRYQQPAKLKKERNKLFRKYWLPVIKFSAL